MIEDSSHYLRKADVVAVGTAGHLLIIDGGGVTFEVATSCITEWSTLLQDLIVPMRGTILRKRLRELPETDRAFFASMLDRGVLLQCGDPVSISEQRDRVLVDNQGYHLDRGMPKCRHLVVALTGSIVCGLMPPVILSLAYSGYQGQLDVLLTETSLKFITRDFFESYGIRTWVQPFERRDGINVPHVSLGTSADCVLVMPATANALWRLAQGACSDLLSLTVAATTAPIVVVPTMNAAMWNNAAVQRNVQQLRKDGMYVVEPSLIFKATALVDQGNPMYGGPGTFWRGPLGVMQSVSAVLAHRRRAIDHVDFPRSSFVNCLQPACSQQT